MKIRFLRDCKYPQNEPSQSREYKAGEVYDLDDDHAQRWLRRGVAEVVKTAAKVSKPEAMVPAPPAKPATHESIAAVRQAAAKGV